MPDELNVVDNPVADSTRFDLEAAEGKGEDEGEGGFYILGFMFNVDVFWCWACNILLWVRVRVASECEGKCEGG